MQRRARKVMAADAARRKAEEEEAARRRPKRKRGARPKKPEAEKVVGTPALKPDGDDRSIRRRGHSGSPGAGKPRSLADGQIILMPGADSDPNKAFSRNRSPVPEVWRRHGSSGALMP